MARKRAFPLGAVLTILHGRNFADHEFEVRQLLAFLIRNDAHIQGTGVSMSAIMQEQDGLRRQLPELVEATTPPDSFESAFAARAWVSQMVAKHGAMVEVSPNHPRRRRRS